MTRSDSYSQTIKQRTHIQVVDITHIETDNRILFRWIHRAIDLQPINALELLHTVTCEFLFMLLNDSKQLSEKKRYQLREIIERDAVAWAVGIVTPDEIDQINILNASILAMHRALDQLKVRPEAIIVDGNRFKPYQDLPHTTIVKGDGKYLAIAAASILAKTYRDDYMNQLAEEYPQYDWFSNKGYPTKKHRDAIRQYGITPYHRKSYNLLGDGQLSLDFGD